jgi:hypothetical protein
MIFGVEWAFDGADETEMRIEARCSASERGEESRNAKACLEVML